MLLSSPANSIYFPSMESQTNRSLQQAACQCADYDNRFPQYWLDDTDLNMQFVANGSAITAINLVHDGGTIAVPFTTTVGTDSKTYSSVTSLSLNAYSGQLIRFEVTDSLGGVTHESWPIAVVSAENCQELSKIDYEGADGCIENGILWGGTGVENMCIFIRKCANAFEMVPEIDSFTDGNGTIQICHSESTEEWDITFDFAPLGYIRKINHILQSRLVLIDDGQFRTLAPLQQDIQFGSRPIYRSQVRLVYSEVFTHATACC